MLNDVTPQGVVWIIDDDQSIRFVLDRALKQSGFEVTSFDSADQALLHMKSHDLPDTILSDLHMPGVDGFEFLQTVHEADAMLPVIIMTAYSDLDTTVQAYQGGAFDYLSKPFDLDEAVNITSRACQYRHENTAEAEPSVEAENDTRIIGDSPAMQEVFRAIGRLSRSNITVLINGESGTGKERVAAALHEHSPRSAMPFIAINTAAIPKDLLESELFGHEKGSFTGAQAQRKGRFEQANGGTLFLDEIGDMPMELQTRLLRVLAEGEFYRVGGHLPISVDVRIITATHQDLLQLVEQGKFREDLYHRLNVIRIKLPALRERSEDIPLLMSYYMSESARELGEEPKTVPQEVMHYLSQLPWPGNVRQLENLCRYFTVMASGKEVHMSDLPSELQNDELIHSAQEFDQQWSGSLATWARKQLAAGQENLLDTAEPLFEKTMLNVALETTGGRKQEAAKLLGWGRNTLTRKLKELGIEGS